MAAEALEQSMLESKDKDQLLAIAKALGLKAGPRTKKSEIIDLILETTGHGPSSDPAPEPEPDAESPVVDDGDGDVTVTRVTPTHRSGRPERSRRSGRRSRRARRVRRRLTAPAVALARSVGVTQGGAGCGR